MLLLLRLILGLALPIYLGYCVIALIYYKEQDISFLERFALAWSIGAGLFGLELFALSLFGLPLTLGYILIVNLPIIILLSIYILSRKITLLDLNKVKNLKSFFMLNKGETKWIALAEKLLILLIAITIIYTFFDALIKPVVTFDALWRQASIAKNIYISGKILTSQSILIAAHHPYLNPILQAWAYMSIGEWNDALGKIIFPLFFSSMLLLFYANLRRYTSRFYALLFTYILTSFTLIVYHAGCGYSDLMQTFYFSVGIIYLYNWMEKKTNAHLYISALFLGIGNFVKQSGIPLWGIAAIVLFIYLFLENRNKIRSGLNFLFISIIASSPWLFYRDSFLMKNIIKIFSRAAPASAPLAQNLAVGLPTLPNIFYHLGKRMFTYADAQILWFVIIMVCLLCFKQIWHSKLKYLLLLIVLQIVLVIYVFTDPQTYQYLVDGTLVERVVMYGNPAALFFVAAIMFDKFPKFAARISPRKKS